jgi:hypothetical protein
MELTNRIVCKPWAWILVAALSTSLATVASWPVRAVTPSGCTNLDAIPPQFTISYQAAIQGLFNNFNGANGCTDCHEPSAGPTGGLDLTGGVSWSNLVYQLSAQDSMLTRVIPNNPDASLLFQKINCDTPGIGQRMPYGFPPLSPEQQALIYDWIAGGAPFTTTDTIFRGGFETRG